ncbi:MAG: hypothetical protein K6D37_07560 [Prevotella sp.]|nr:hypothetical protein [Prevotella sp.]
MRRLTIHIGGALLLLMAMLMTACVTGDGDGGGVVIGPETDDCYLDIYVYAPDRPIVTRADVGPIAAIYEAESKIHSLQIWVFRHSDASTAPAVGYLEPDPVFLNETGYQKYQMLLDRDFVKTLEAVDVYVVANAASVGLTTLNKKTTRASLDAAVINTEYFGTTDLYDKDELDQDGHPDATPASGRIATSGLPMSAIVEEQPIWGSFPHLRIGRSENETTILELTRAVSKLRFVLCQIKNQVETKTLESINEIKLNGGLIPTETSLLPGTTSYTGKYVTGNPPSDAITYVGAGKAIEKLVHALAANSPSTHQALPAVDNPLVYAYETQNAQVYEDLINHAADEESSRKLTNRTWLNQYGADNDVEELKADKLTTDDLPQLKELGLTYLRESDKQLTGTINYTYITGQDQTGQNITETKEATFAMAAPGDFLRNHSWIVYIYYMDSEIYTLTVTHIGMRSWNDDPNSENPIVYNW